jgi:hypothetical protein
MGNQFPAIDAEDEKRLQEISYKLYTVKYLSNPASYPDYNYSDLSLDDALFLITLIRNLESQLDPLNE